VSVTNPSVYISDLDDPIVTVHQSIGEAKEQFYYERTVFLRCAANSNPPVRYSWRRGREFLSQGSDKGVEIYEPFFTQGETKILKLKNLRPQDYANYTCTASVRNVCGIPDKSVLFRLTNKTGERCQIYLLLVHSIVCYFSLLLLYLSRPTHMKVHASSTTEATL
ncbi:hypothetical protein PO909_011808, partial [Leuciscus waleckii]